MTSAHEADGRFVAQLADSPSVRPTLTPTERVAPDVLGPLARFLDPAVTDLFVNGDGSLWLDRGDGARPVTGFHLPAAQARELATRLIAAGDRHVDEATPCADVRLGDGLRVHVVLPPLARGGALVSIRQSRAERWSLEALDREGLFELVAAERIRRLVDERANVLITGGAGTGKTTLLAAMLAAAPPADRIVVLEDVAELRIEHPHVVALETRQANLEGAGAVGLERLVREALRMRPDRLVVGECRGAELRELLTALNTGHEGGAGTLHANSLADVPARLEALGALAGLDAASLARQAVSAFDAVIHLGRVHGRRRVLALGALRRESERLLVHDEAAG